MKTVTLILIYFLCFYIGWYLTDIFKAVFDLVHSESKSKEKHSDHSEYTEYEEVESLDMCKSDYNLHNPTCIDDVTGDNNKIIKK